MEPVKADEQFYHEVYERIKEMQANTLTRLNRASTVPEKWRASPFLYRYRFLDQMHDRAGELGLLPERFGKEDPCHIASYARLRAIWDMSEQLACGHARWLARNISKVQKYRKKRVRKYVITEIPELNWSYEDFMKHYLSVSLAG